MGTLKALIVNVRVTLRLCRDAREQQAVDTGVIEPAERDCAFDWAQTKNKKIRAALLEISGDLDQIERLDLRFVRNGSQLMDFQVVAYPNNEMQWLVILSQFIAARGPRPTSAARDLEKRRWVADHGSTDLQTMVAHGYSAERRYAEERAALEYPSFTLLESLHSEPIDSPHSSALALATSCGGRVAWLPQPPPDLALFPAPSPAVLIEGYLGRWVLLHSLASDHEPHQSALSISNAND